MKNSVSEVAKTQRGFEAIRNSFLETMALDYLCDIA